MAETVGGGAVRFVLVDLIADFVFFPVWWYTAGFVRALRTANGWLTQTRRMMAVGLWTKNLFVPMFAQYDVWGRVISFLVRVAMIVGRSIGLLIVVLLLGVFLLAWAFFPPFLAALIVSQVLALATAV